MLTPDALAEHLPAALAAAGVPADFAVVPRHQLVPAAEFDAIARLVAVFDRVTTRPAWQAAAQAEAPPIAQWRRRETCFFSACDFHLPPGGGAWLIECNDNGSGMLLTGLVNAAYWQAAGLAGDAALVPPRDAGQFAAAVAALVRAEAAGWFGALPEGVFLVLDDAESLRNGHFRAEFGLLCEIFRGQGWAAAIAAPEQTAWDGARLLVQGHPVAFVVNRATDFFWQAPEFAALRAAYAADAVYVAPNPFSYATRSDKRLLEWLSLPDWDGRLGILPEERQVLTRHVPETHLVRPENVELLARQKHDFVFKPLHGFAGHGVLDSDAVGRARLRHLALHGPGYVAQRRVAKPEMPVAGQDLWTDLRVWFYRGRIVHLSGRGSTRPDRLALIPPGGWLPTYVSRGAMQAPRI